MFQDAFRVLSMPSSLPVRIAILLPHQQMDMSATVIYGNSPTRIWPCGPTDQRHVFFLDLIHEHFSL